MAVKPVGTGQPAHSAVSSLGDELPTEGLGTWYGKRFQGRKTASGERFDVNKLTAAHRTLPFNTMVEVTNLKTNKSVIVKVNDRGPAHKEYIIDLSQAAAKKIGLLSSSKVSIRVLSDTEGLDQVAK